MIKRSDKIKAGGAYAFRCVSRVLLDISPTRPFGGSLTGDTCASHKFRYSKTNLLLCTENSTFIAAEAPEYKDVGDLEYEANLKVWLWLISADPITRAVSDANTIIVRLAHPNRKPLPVFIAPRIPAMTWLPTQCSRASISGR